MDEEEIKNRPTPITTKIDPTEFDVTMCAVLTGLGADKYVDLFRKRNIGQYTLTEFTDDDLIKLGISDENIRKTLLQEAKNLPIYEKSLKYLSRSNSALRPNNIVDILEETSQHLYKMYLSMLANTLALKKTKNISDSQLHEDKYASDLALSALIEINTILNSMDITMRTQIKTKLAESRKKRNKKVIIGAFGSVAIAVLAMLFVKSLKQLRGAA